MKREPKKDRTDLFLRAFGQVVQERRKDLHLSQEELADRAELHRTYIGDIERGVRNVALRNVYRLAQALDTSPGDLMSETDRKVEKGR